MSQDDGDKLCKRSVGIRVIEYKELVYDRQEINMEECVYVCWSRQQNKKSQIQISTQIVG